VEEQMAKVLVAYGSKMGGTAGIAERVAETLKGRGHQVTLAPAGKVPRRMAWDAAVVGSGLYAGHWRRDAVRLLKRLARPGEKPARVWLFHSGPIGDEHADDPVALPAKVQALAASLHAEDVVTFGGRVSADAPGFVAKAMVRNNLVGDWRRLDHAEAWANSIAVELAG
jgi:menaquinone-dependent protoporphyrinogen oxidase